jgi:hypothetical protein
MTTKLVPHTATTAIASTAWRSGSAFTRPPCEGATAREQI